MFNFIGNKYKFLLVSLVLVITAIAALILAGLKPAIDFTGGGIIEMQSEKCAAQDCSAELNQVFADQQVQIVSIENTEDYRFRIKTKPIDQGGWEEIKNILVSKFDDFEEKSFETIGPTLGQELLEKTAYAVFLVMVMLMIYIGWRFQSWMYGVTAIIALLHDMLVIIGAFAIFGHFFGIEVGLMFVTATLTALAFSVHDTIVLYDRIREMLRRNPKEEFNTVVNIAINGTLVRSLSTSLSILFVLTALALLAGDTIFWFVVALLIGTISGSYSSPFVAAPLLTIWKERSKSTKIK